MGAHCQGGADETKQEIEKKVTNSYVCNSETKNMPQMKSMKCKLSNNFRFVPYKHPPNSLSAYIISSQHLNPLSYNNCLDVHYILWQKIKHALKGFAILYLGLSK